MIKEAALSCFFFLYLIQRAVLLVGQVGVGYMTVWGSYFLVSESLVFVQKYMGTWFPSELVDVQQRINKSYC